MLQCRALVVALFASLTVCTVAWADVPEAVSIDLEMIAVPSGGQMFQISAMAVSDTVTRGALEVHLKGDFVMKEEVLRPVTLIPQRPTKITLPFRPAGGGDLGIVAVRLLDHSTGDPLVVRVFHVGGTPESGHVLTDEEVEDVISHRNAQHLRTSASERADRLIRELRGSGRRAVPIEGRDLTVEDEEWNQAVQVSDASAAEKLETGPPRPRNVQVQTCGVFDTVTSNNYVYTLAGTLDYIDEYLGGGEYTTGYGGHAVEVTTLVEYTDGCGGTQVRSKTYGPVSTSTGIFTINNFKSIIAAPNNPATRLKVTFVAAGQASWNWDLIPGEQMLFNQADFPVEWLSTGPMLRALFTSSNSTASYYFRWNEGARRAERQLNNESFRPTLRAGYDPNEDFLGAHVGVVPGLVGFGPTGKWVSRWVSSHEFGHLFNLYLSGPLPGGAHQTCVANDDLELALSEGFADWHASKWDSQGRSAYFPNCTNSDCPPCNTSGYAIEGNVQAFLWDVFDSVNHANDQGVDTVWKPLSRLWDYDGYIDLDHFIHDWTVRGLWGLDLPAIQALRPVCKVVNP